MSDTIKLLNENAGALNILFAAIVALSTVIYAVLTALLVVETRRLREVQTEPKIQITIDEIDFAVNIVRLCIKNIGQGAAKNLRLSSSVVSGGKPAEKLLSDFTDSNFFSTGLRYFGPDQLVYSGFTQLTQDFDGKSQSVLGFNIQYENLSGKLYKESLLVDMAEIKGRYRIGTPNLYAIAKSLEKIQQDISHFATGFKKLQVDSYDRKDRENEAMEKEKWMKEAVEELKKS